MSALLTASKAVDSETSSICDIGQSQYSLLMSHNYFRDLKQQDKHVQMSVRFGASNYFYVSDISVICKLLFEVVFLFLLCLRNVYMN